MQGVVVFIVLIYLGIIFAGQRKAKQDAQKRKEETARRQSDAARFGVRTPQAAASARPGQPGQPFYRTAQPARTAQPGRVVSVLDEEHYHREGYDFATCFSFKDVPPGTDELTALIRANSRHERELQKLMHTSDQR